MNHQAAFVADQPHHHHNRPAVLNRRSNPPRGAAANALERAYALLMEWGAPLSMEIAHETFFFMEECDGNDIIKEDSATALALPPTAAAA